MGGDTPRSRKASREPGIAYNAKTPGPGRSPETGVFALYIRLDHHSLFSMAWLCVENTTAQPVKIENNTVQTTKGDPLERGYGLKIVASLLAENGGTYTLNYLEKERLFGFYSTIPCPEKTE